MEASVDENKLLNDYLSFTTLFKAYKKSSNPSKSLPGINLSEEQLFWIALTQRFCTFEKDMKTTMNKLNQGVYPINQFRNEIPMRFINEFSNSFECRKDIELVSQC